MNAEQIRAEAIEVIAQAQYVRSRKPGSPEWGDPSPGFRWLWQTHRDMAAVDVDALAAAGLLPTEPEWGVDESLAGEPTIVGFTESNARAAELQGGTAYRRLCTDWRKAE